MDKAEKVIEFSPIESEILNLKVGRIANDKIDIDALKTEILDGEYDLCRFKISSEVEETVMQLDKLGFPYHFSASIRRYTTPVASLKERAFLHPDIEYIKFDESKNDLLKSMLIDCWGKYPIGYYRTPYLNDIISKEQEILCVYDFYKEHNLQKKHPNNTIMFMKHKGEFVGFFALNIIDNRLESHIGGILAPYREGGYFFDMQEYIRRFCIDNNLKFFCFGARNENSRVQSIFEKFGYKAGVTENVFHIPTLLSVSQLPIETRKVNLQPQSNKDLYATLLELFNNDWFNELLPNFNRQNFVVSELNAINTGTYQVKISVPILEDNKVLGVLGIYNQANKLVCFGHLDRRV